METKKEKESLEDQLKSLTEKLNFEQKTICELRNFINVMKDGWSSDKAKLLVTTEKLNEAEEKLTHREKDNLIKQETEANKSFDEQKTTKELRNFIDVMKEGWSSDKAKLLEVTEKLNKVEEKLIQNEKDSKDRLTMLEIELEGERKTIGDLRNFIDVMKSGWSLDRAKLLSTAEELNEKQLEQYSFVGKNNNSGNTKMLPNKKVDVDKNITISTKTKYKFKWYHSLSKKITKDILDQDPLRITEEAHISCPLCWNGFLPSLKNLKYKLLIILTSVLCPLCFQNCDDIRSLVNHLEIGCGNNGVPELLTSGVQAINDNQFEDLYTVVDINRIKQEKEPLIQGMKKEDVMSSVEVGQGESIDASSTSQSLHNDEGYWVKRSNVYNFVINEEKMRMLDPSFVRPEYKINTSVTKTKLYSKKYMLKLINKLEPIDGVKTVHSRRVSIYIVDENKARDKQNLKSTVTVEPRTKLLEHNSKPETDNCLSEIKILKVSLANDKEITIENVDFDDLPSVPESIVPFLAKVNNPQIPLFEGAKILKWKCTLCLSIYNRLYSAIKHSCYKCKYCGNGFRTNITVFTHHQLECGKKNANSAKPFACSNCPSFFRTLEEAQSHMPAHYSGSTAVQCGRCYCFFSDKTVLNRHLIEEHDINSDPSQLDSAVKRRKYTPNNKFRHNVLGTDSSTFSENNTKSESITKEPCDSSKKQSNKSGEAEVQIKDANIKDVTPLRSQRKRKANKIYCDQFLLY